MARSTSDYAGALKALLPQGRVWRVEQGSGQEAVLNALGAGWARLDAAAEELLDGSLPGQFADMLPEWEETLGLSGSISGLTTAQRSAQVLSRFIANGGQSIAFLTSFAATLGFAITITTYARCRAGIATAGSPVYAENWASALGIHITANTSGLASSALIAALSPIISAHVAIFLV